MPLGVTVCLISIDAPAAQSAIEVVATDIHRRVTDIQVRMASTLPSSDGRYDGDVRVYSSISS